MREVLRRFNLSVKIPLMIDSTEWPVIEESLKNVSGKPIINSINLEDGEDASSGSSRWPSGTARPWSP